MAETTQERTERVIGEFRSLVEDLAESGRERVDGAERKAAEDVSRYHAATEELDAARREIAALENDREKLPNLAFKANMDEEFEREDELREKYRNTRPLLEALRGRVGELEAEIAALVGPNPTPRGDLDAMIHAYTVVRETYRESAAPLIEIERQASRILRDAVGPLSAGHRGWGNTLQGLREQRSGDPEVLARSLQRRGMRPDAPQGVKSEPRV
jgi:chromosome segregation ATPase